MKKTKPILTSFFVLLSILLYGQTDFETKQKFTSLQKEVISKLTANEPIQDEIFLNQRATAKEREIAVDYLSKTLTSLGWENNNQHYKSPNSNLFLDFFFKPISGINVIGILPASNPSEEYIILGAHYDTERGSPGAIDNATGVALCLSLAQNLKQIENRFYNYVIVFFDQEEDDGVGSREYVQKIKTRNLKVHSVHIFDLMGWDSDNNKAVTFQSPSEFLEETYSEQAKRLNIPFKVISGGASDNKQFLGHGYETIGVFEDVYDSTPHHHTPADNYDTVNFDYLASTTQLVYNVLIKIENK